MIIVSLLVLLPLAGLVYQALFVEAPIIASSAQSLPELWQRYRMGELLVRTLQLGFSVACFNILLGCGLAWTTQRLRFTGRKVLALASLIPLAIPSFIYAATLRDSLSPGGWIGEMFALPVFSGFGPATLVLTLATLPYTQLLLTTRLSSLAYQQQEEAAARSLGASVRAIFWRITWPYLRPAIIYAWLISFLYAISDFGAVAVLNYPVLTWQLYQAVEYQQLLLASLLGSLLLLISLPVFFGSRLLQTHKLQNLRERKQTWINLDLPQKWYLAIFLTYLFVLVIGVVVPLTTMAQWVYQGWIMQLPFADIGSPLLATLVLAVGGASIISVLAYFPAWVAARARHFIDHYLEQLVYLTNGLPSILVGFGLLLAALMISSFSSSWIYHTLLTSGILLICGYTLRFLPQAYAYLKTAILNLDDHQYASAKLLGASSFYGWRRLALPRLWISIRAAWIVVILGISKELPITLLLGNATGLQPLSVRMFDRYQEAFLYDAGLAGLVLVLLCVALTAWTLRSAKGYLNG